MSTTRRRGCLALAATALLGVAGKAHAHAILRKSMPAAGATVPPGPLAITLQFNTRIDRVRSRVTLARAGGAAVVLDLESPSDDILTATATLAAGAHSLRWQVLAIDGHITRGDVPFTVRPG